MQETSFKKLVTFLLGSYGLMSWNIVLNTIEYFETFANKQGFFN